MKLKNKKILVTGGSKGIGKGISKVFLQNGANVIICGRNPEDLEKTCNELSRFGDIRSRRTDLTSKKEVKELGDFVKNTYDSLDVLVNNASILGKMVTIEDYPEDIWDEVIDINLNAQFYITKKMIPLLKKSPDGASIINVSSSVGRSGRAYWGAYSVSKFGIEALTQILAQELQNAGVRVNSLNPGGTRTDMRSEAYPEEDPMELPTAEQIAPAFVYLASYESANENGKQFNARDWL